MDRRYARTLFFLAAALLVGDGSIPPAATAAAIRIAATMLPATTSRPVSHPVAATRPHKIRTNAEKSARVGKITPPTSSPPALREGMILTNVPGWLVPSPADRYPRLVFLHPRRGWPKFVRLLPCLPLEELQAANQLHLIFVVDGQVSVYHGQSYLLLGPDIRLLRIAAASPEAARYFRAINRVRAGRENPRKILQRLLHHHILQPIHLSTPLPPAATVKFDIHSPVPAEPTQWPVRREGSYIWNRCGRLIHDPRNGTWLFAFAANRHAQESPTIMLLPCHWLSVIRSLDKAQGAQRAFRISGRVTEYDGRNYLLLTYVQVFQNLGRF